MTLVSSYLVKYLNLMAVSEDPPSSDHPRTVIATRNEALLGLSPASAGAGARVMKVGAGQRQAGKD